MQPHLILRQAGISAAGHYTHVQISLARLGAGFGPASADIFQTESLCILAERLSQREIGFPLIRTCHNQPLKKRGSSHTEI